MHTKILGLCFLLASVAVNADSFFYCTKNGKKIVTDRPCAELGAQQTKRVESENMPALNTVRGLTQGDLNESQAIDARNEQDYQSRQARRQEQQALASENKAVCKSLQQEKDSITAAQRMPNTMQSLNYYRERLLEVNNELYRLRCETL